MKPRAERLEWIVAYLRARDQPGLQYRVDVLNRDFVDEYIEATGAAADAMPYGADKCPRLGKDLARLAREGRLERQTTGVEGLAGMGFPRWVWSYRLSAG